MAAGQCFVPAVWPARARAELVGWLHPRHPPTCHRSPPTTLYLHIYSLLPNLSTCLLPCTRSRYLDCILSKFQDIRTRLFDIVFIFGKSVLTVTISASTIVKIVRVWRSSAPVQNLTRTCQILVASDFPNSKPLFDIIDYDHNV